MSKRFLITGEDGFLPASHRETDNPNLIRTYMRDVAADLDPHNYSTIKVYDFTYHGDTPATIWTRPVGAKKWELRAGTHGAARRLS